MDNGKLRSCPFCGHDAVIEVFKARKGYEATVQCTNCLANMSSITFDDEKTAEYEVIKAWNARQSNRRLSTCDTCKWLEYPGVCSNESSKYVGFLMIHARRCNMYERN